MKDNGDSNASEIFAFLAGQLDSWKTVKAKIRAINAISLVPNFLETKRSYAARMKEGTQKNISIVEILANFLGTPFRYVNRKGVFSVEASSTTLVTSCSRGEHTPETSQAN